MQWNPKTKTTSEGYIFQHQSLHVIGEGFHVVKSRIHFMVHFISRKWFSFTVQERYDLANFFLPAKMGISVKPWLIIYTNKYLNNISHNKIMWSTIVSRKFLMKHSKCNFALIL